MRALILVASAGVLLASCKDNSVAENTALIGDNLAAEAIIANDTTAIDAATSDASNMAADVAFSPEDAETDDTSRPSGRSSSSRARRAPSDSAKGEPTRQDEPAAPMETATENSL